jgi:hypothetical protein
MAQQDSLTRGSGAGGAAFRCLCGVHLNEVDKGSAGPPRVEAVVALERNDGFAARSVLTLMLCSDWDAADATGVSAGTAPGGFGLTWDARLRT